MILLLSYPGGSENLKKTNMDKRKTFRDVLPQISSGCTLAIGGMTLYRRPISFVRRLIDYHLHWNSPEHITLMALTGGIECDWLIGAGMIDRVRTCYFGLEIFGLAPMFTYYGNSGALEIIEETEASLAFGLRAQMAGIGFMPGRGWLGTDLPKLRPDVKTVIDPYNGEELIAFPAIQPDVAVIHALKADFDGNAIIGKNKGIDEELAVTAGYVIITAEEVVPELSEADLVAPFVHAVITTPNGANPSSCHPLYALNGEAILAYTEQVSDPQSFNVYQERNISVTQMG
jgi:glutaconate CoA-transferase subunit A